MAMTVTVTVTNASKPDGDGQHRHELTAAELRELLDYDPNTGIFAWKTRLRNGVQPGDRAGTTLNGRAVIRIRGRSYRAHRIAYCWMTGLWPQGYVDHRNGNIADNRWENLRAVTCAQNRANSRVQRSNRLGVKGVRYIERNGHPFMATFRHRYLGCFATLDEAQAAYERAAEDHYGDFAFHKSRGAAADE
jgi:hypothetical protein